MNVFITIDTEFHPLDGIWSREKRDYLIRRDIDGKTATGEVGVYFQADMLKKHGLKGVFFVEALSGYVAGPEFLKRIVSYVQNCGHGVGLQLHPEWLRRAPAVSVLPGREGDLMQSFNEEDQTILIAKGVEMLRMCGVDKVYSFRAGSYGANLDTLKALARNGIPIDSSHNLAWPSTSAIRTEKLLLQPERLSGVLEFPVSCYQDWPSHWRHAQLTACSSNELKSTLLSAWRQGWDSFVIVSHSFELIKGRNEKDEPYWRADDVVVNRFNRLCEFLAENRDKFTTTRFADVDPKAVPTCESSGPIMGSWTNTLGRYVEQAYRRISLVFG